MARFPTRANCYGSFRLYLAGVLAVCVIFAECRGAQTAAQPNRVAIAYPSPGPRVAPLWIAQDLDFFGKYGVTPQVRANIAVLRRITW